MKKAWIFQGGWEGHEPKLTSARFAGMLEKNGFETRILDSLEPVPYEPIDSAVNRVFAAMEEQEEAPATTKMCPYCKSDDVPLGACKCKHCGSELELSDEEKAALEA